MGEVLTILPADATVHGPPSAIKGEVLAAPLASASECGPEGTIMGDVLTIPPTCAPAQAGQGEMRKTAQDPLFTCCGSCGCDGQAAPLGKCALPVRAKNSLAVARTPEGENAVTSGAGAGHASPPVMLGESKPKSLRSTTSRGAFAATPVVASSSSIVSHAAAARSFARRAALRRPPRVRRRRFPRRLARFESADRTSSQPSSMRSPSDTSMSDMSSSISMSKLSFLGDTPPCEEPISDREASVIAVEGVPHDGCEQDFKLMRAV